MCFPSQSILSGFSWENQIVNLYGLAELHMENCLAEWKAQLGLCWQAESENISTWHSPPTLLRFILCCVCLFSWPIPLAGRSSSLVYDSSHNVWILSLTLAWFLEGAPLWTTMPLKNNTAIGILTLPVPQELQSKTNKQLATNEFNPLDSPFFSIFS